MPSKRHILNKVTAILDKRANLVGAGLSFRVILEGEPDEVFRSRGFTNEQHNKHNPIQTTENPTNG